MIPDQIRTRQINRIVSNGPINQAGFRLPASSAVIGVMWAHINGIESHTVFTEEAGKFFVNRLQIPH